MCVFFAYGKKDASYLSDLVKEATLPSHQSCGLARVALRSEHREMDISLRVLSEVDHERVDM